MERKPIHKLIRIFHKEREKLNEIVVVIRHRVGKEEVLKEIDGSSILYVKKDGFYFNEDKNEEEMTFIPSHRMVEVRKKC